MRLLTVLLPAALGMLLAATPLAALAQAGAKTVEPVAEPAAEAIDVATLDTVVVTGNQPGPGLWRVSKDDHVMWILGTLGPLPRRMQWEAREVRETLAEAQEVIMLPGMVVGAKLGFFSGLALVPSALRARGNPDKEKLVDVLPAQLYERWLPLKKRYLRGSRAVEKRRPILAAQRLYQRALKANGLRGDDLVSPLVAKEAKKRKLLVTRPSVEIKIEDPKQMLKEINGNALDDVACFEQILNRVESDLPALKARANAWAEGDVDRLRELPVADAQGTCMNAVLSAQAAKDRGMSDIREQARTKWLEAAETALGRNTVTFALLPIGDLLDPKGTLAILVERGYEIDGP